MRRFDLHADDVCIRAVRAPRHDPAAMERRLRVHELHVKAYEWQVRSAPRNVCPYGWVHAMNVRYKRLHAPATNLPNKGYHRRIGCSLGAGGG
jgi:hypothetical protein